MKSMSWKDHANNSWRAEEAAFAIVVAIASNEDSEEYDRFLISIRQVLQKAMRSSSIPSFDIS